MCARTAARAARLAAASTVAREASDALEALRRLTLTAPALAAEGLDAFDRVVVRWTHGGPVLAGRRTILAVLDALLGDAVRFDGLSPDRREAVIVAARTVLAAVADDASLHTDPALAACAAELPG